MEIKLPGSTPGVLSTPNSQGSTTITTGVVGTSNENITFESGAKRGEIAAAYHLIPPEAKKRVAMRYGGGAEKYGILNYFTGINDPAFVRQVLDHLEEHLEKFKIEGCSKDDNLAAIVWAAMTLMVIEEHNPTILTDGIFGARLAAITKAVTSERPQQNLYEGKAKTV